ncbi:MAG: phospholipid/cholesterol/gamma-HCH transport system substrate-binding protein, partial [Thermoleophilaceae bacterium]|nr:phospholipid/cholesterol/gamma-HCH transport system substrate-binding protein [Thermoleophilaceae bacterium]
MDKQGPGVAKLGLMVAFVLGCFVVLLFLWVSFGGNIPLKPKQYELRVSFQDAATLAENADVRIAGVNVGKVRKKELDKGASATRVVLSIDPRFAPLPSDTRAILRQKSLLGETYVELTPGSASAKKLKDGAVLSRTHVEPTTELDEILQIFDKPTKRAFRAWIKDQAMITAGSSPQNLNDALGNLSSFATDGADILGVLVNQKQALRLLVKNTGVVFGALNERQGELRSLIQNSDRTFSATAQEKTALAETFAIFPTFLDESKATMARLETFSRNTQPLIEDLQPVADDLAPTIRDVSNLSPDLEALFRNLPPVIRASTRDLPQAQRFLRGAIPVFAGLHQFLPELNPILSFANFDQQVLAGFVTNGSLATNYDLKSGTDAASNDGINDYALAQFGVINNTSLQLNSTR